MSKVVKEVIKSMLEAPEEWEYASDPPYREMLVHTPSKQSVDIKTAWAYNFSSGSHNTGRWGLWDQYCFHKALKKFAALKMSLKLGNTKREEEREDKQAKEQAKEQVKKNRYSELDI
jgi:hypothetical protein